MHFILFISDYHHICYRFLLLRSSLHTPFYKPKSTIHASPQSGIPDTRTHYTGRKNWRSASEQNFYDNHRPGKRYSMKDETKQPEINAGIIFASQGFSVHFAPHQPKGKPLASEDAYQYHSIYPCILSRSHHYEYIYVHPC